MRPSTSPGASPTHAVRRPSAAKSSSMRSAAGAAVPGPRVSSTSGEPSSGGSTWKPTAPPPPSRACSEPSAHSSATGPPCSGGPSGSAPASISSHGTSPSASSWSRASKPARAASARSSWATASLAGHRPRAGPRPPPGAGGARVLGALARVLVPAAPALAPEAPGRHHPRAQRRGPPARLAEAELVEGERDLVADVDADEVLQLEGAHAKAGGAGDRVDGLDVGHALLQELERLEAEGPVAAVDQEAGPVGGVDDVLAHRPPGRARDLERLGRGVDAGDDLDEAP